MVLFVTIGFEISIADSKKKEKFSPGDKISWGEYITNSTNNEQNDRYQCIGLVIKQDEKLLHVKGSCVVPMHKDKKTNKVIYMYFQTDDYITVDDVKYNHD